jgi:hypothetical protein
MTDIDHRRDTKEAAAFLTSLGYRTAPATLTKLRCIGGGRSSSHSVTGRSTAKAICLHG